MKEISAINNNSITSVSLQEVVYLNLQYFDGVKSKWFDSLALPQCKKDYATKGTVVSWANQSQKKVRIMVEVFGDTYTLPSTWYKLTFRKQSVSNQ